MLNEIIRLSLRYRTLVIAISLMLLVYGTWLIATMPIDVFPDLDRPRVVLLTECPGLASEEVETLVSQPLEIALLSGSGVEAVRSYCSPSLNVIYVEFDWDVNSRHARQTVQERLAVATGNLPPGIIPQMTPQSSIMGQILIAGLFRQQGPSDGRLAAISGTDLVAEWIQNNEAHQLKIWQTLGKRQPQQWKPIEFQLISDASSAGSRQSRVRIDGSEFAITFDSPDRENLELGTIGDWVIRQRLLKVPGVAEIFVQGGDRQQFQVLLNPDSLLDFGVTVQDVRRALRESNLNASGGFAITGESEKPIRILGRVGPRREIVIQDLKKVPVKSSSRRSILLGDIAEVDIGPESKRGDAAVDGQAAVVFSIVKQPHVDTRKLTREIERTLSELESTLPVIYSVDSNLFQLSDFIERGVFNVAEALAIGAFLVIVILFLFLLNFRTTFITLTAIPLSIVITAIVFRLTSYLTGMPISINVMTLGGMAVAIGELVDDAIVDVENIFRRLRQNRNRENPDHFLRVVYDASREIRSAIVFGTIVVILAFLPLFWMSGLSGRLFVPLGFAYIVSILSSLLVSLTLTPVLSSFLLPQSSSTHREQDSALLGLLKFLATPFIRLGMAIPSILLTLTWIGFAAAAILFANMGGGFLPDFDEGSLQLNATLPPGSSLAASNKMTSLIDATLSQKQKSEDNPSGEVLHFVRRTGRAEMDEHAMPVNASEYVISMNPEIHGKRNQTIKQLREQLKQEVPGVSIEVEQPLAHLISHMVSGVRAQIAIKIFGDDLDILQRLANQAKSLIEDIPGITSPVIEPIQQTEELHIRLDADSLAFHGVTRAYVADILQTALRGELISEIIQDQRRFDLVLRFEESFRTDYSRLEKLRLDLPDGRGQVELRDLAVVESGYGPNVLFRDNARRRMVIRCNTQGRDLSGTAQAIQRRLNNELKLPQGYFLEFAGQFESQRQAEVMIAVLGTVALAGIFVTLLILFPSFRIVLQILNALPVAFIGGVLALYFTRQDITVAALVGFVSLGGIAIRNGILLVSHYIHLMSSEGEPFSKSMILRGSLERLAPVLMTALTAGIALVPLVVDGNEPGREILYPVATVILGGLFTSTFCEFLIHPGLFWRFTGRDAENIAQQHSNEADPIF